MIRWRDDAVHGILDKAGFCVGKFLSRKQLREANSKFIHTRMNSQYQGFGPFCMSLVQ